MCRWMKKTTWSLLIFILSLEVSGTSDFVTRSSLVNMFFDYNCVWQWRWIEDYRYCKLFLSVTRSKQRVVQMCFAKSLNKLRTHSAFVCQFICISHCGPRLLGVEEIIEQSMVHLGQLAKTLFFVYIYMCVWLSSEWRYNHTSSSIPWLSSHSIPQHAHLFLSFYNNPLHIVFFSPPFLGFGRL